MHLTMRHPTEIHMFKDIYRLKISNLIITSESYCPFEMTFWQFEHVWLVLLF